MILKFIRKLFLTIQLLLIYVRELMASSLRIACDAISPQDRSRPGVVEMDIEPLPEAALLAYCMFIAMTPGSLPIHVTADGRKLYVHAMYLDDPDAFRADLQRQFETPLRQLFS